MLTSPHRLTSQVTRLVVVQCAVTPATFVRDIEDTNAILAENRAG